ncbi:hypothetical protein Bca4012_037821 [Brassica carinata]
MKVLPSGVYEYMFIVEVEAFPLGLSNLHLGAEEYSIEPSLVPPDLQIKFVVSMFLSHAMGILLTDTSDPAVKEDAQSSYHS